MNIKTIGIAGLLGLAYLFTRKKTAAADGSTPIGTVVCIIYNQRRFTGTIMGWDGTFYTINLGFGYIFKLPHEITLGSC